MSGDRCRQTVGASQPYLTVNYILYWGHLPFRNSSIKSSFMAISLETCATERHAETWFKKATSIQVIPIAVVTPWAAALLIATKLKASKSYQ
jgi:hypothetical protein